ncbi:MAG TPA: cytochrome P450 [Solirubrobacteraceae bacterium]|nr:cytochrome P450 [Solirubrobacteraceae bacterium]
MSVSVASRVRVSAASVLDRVPAPGPRALAEPPPGSGLKPVMGEPGLPFLGQTLPMFVDGLGFCRRAHRRYGSVSWTRVIGTQVGVVLGGEAISTVLANRDGSFSSARGWDYFIGPFFNRGVMLMDAPEHRHHRLIMQQAFKRERLRGYLNRMHPAIERGISGWPINGQLRAYAALKALTLDIATEVFVGGELGAEADEINRAFVHAVVAGQALIRADVPIPGAKWHRGIASRRRLEAHFRAQVDAHRSGGGEDLFSVLCRAESEDGERFSDTDVVNHMIFVLMAAHDTSTITLTMMLYYLARKPEWQERLRDESDALGTATPSYEQLEALTSFDLVFRETLRMNAPVGMIARRAIRDAAIDGHFVPAGTLLMLQIYPTHRMEPWWRDPDRFDPTRFDSEHLDEPGPRDSWLPFGSHAHKCIGMHFGAMEVKAILHRLLATRRFWVAPDYVPPLAAGTGPYPADALPVTIAPR